VDAARGGGVRRALALAIAVLAVVLVQWSGGPVPAGSAATALALGFTLLGGALVGDLLGRFNLPRLFLLDNPNWQ
jgi:hypothetical protein